MGRLADSASPEASKPRANDKEISEHGPQFLYQCLRASISVSWAWIRWPATVEWPFSRFGSCKDPERKTLPGIDRRLVVGAGWNGRTVSLAPAPEKDGTSQRLRDFLTARTASGIRDLRPEGVSTLRLLRLFDLRPCIAQRHRAIEYELFRRRIGRIDAKISQSLELPSASRRRAGQARFYPA